MLDIKFLRSNPELVKENIRKKFQEEKVALVDEVIELDENAVLHARAANICAASVTRSASRSVRLWQRGSGKRRSRQKRASLIWRRR